MAKLSQLFDLIKTETVEDTDVIAAVRDIEGSAEDVAFTLLTLRNAIVKTGSNENGRWAKVYETETTGLMVCWRPRTSFGGMTPGTGSITWTFPQAFSTIPAVSGIMYVRNIQSSNDSPFDFRYVIDGEGGRITTTAAHWLVRWEGSGNVNTRDLTAIAIGTFDETP